MVVANYLAMLLSILLLTSEAGTLAGGPACAVEGRIPPVKGQVCGVDHAAKFMLCSSPKAAATTLSAVLIGFANASDAYAKWLRRNNTHVSTALSARANMFRRHVLGTTPAHAVPEDKLETCARPGWLCIFLVRNPRDRAISSFLHAAVTKLGSNWPELIETVGDVARVSVGNYSLRQHVRALQLTRENILRAQRHETRRRWGGGAAHYLPQYGDWLDELSAPAGGKPRYPASLVKFVTVDDVAGGLGAIDAEFRGGGLGLRAIADGLHSSHWRSSPAPKVPNTLTAGAFGAQAPKRRPSKRFLAAGGGGFAASEQRAVVGPKGHGGRQLQERTDAISTDTTAAALCGSPEGLTPRGTKRAPLSNGSQSRRPTSSGCALQPDAYARLQAMDKDLWRQIRCLFHHDFVLYEKHVCGQPWLSARCKSCVAKACGSW